MPRTSSNTPSTRRSRRKPAVQDVAKPIGKEAEPQREKIVRRKLADEVLDRLQQMIISGEPRPGDPMPSERDLMERFGVGRPAIREALQTMHMMGLITINHGLRSRVNALSADNMLERLDAVAQMLLSAAPDQLQFLKEARRMFESGVVRLATERATPEDIEALGEVLAEQRDSLGDAEAFMEADIRFHARIAEISGNPIIAAVAKAMLRWLFRYHTPMLRWSGREHTTLSEHAAIIKLIAAGDADGAVDAMRRHLDRSNGLYKHAAE